MLEGSDVGTKLGTLLGAHDGTREGVEVGVTDGELLGMHDGVYVG